VVVGAALYLASRRFSPREDDRLAATFGAAWDDYVRTVWLPWL
jgi:protein-S-isoprenylcysteine O-methyltransferase Ste14